MEQANKNVLSCSGCGTRVGNVLYTGEDFRCKCGAFTKIGGEITAGKTLVLGPIGEWAKREDVEG